jgi:hypothetical protein
MENYNSQKKKRKMENYKKTGKLYVWDCKPHNK